jgi:hypothetical protein
MRRHLLVLAGLLFCAPLQAEPYCPTEYASGTMLNELDLDAMDLRKNYSVFAGAIEQAKEALRISDDVHVRVWGCSNLRPPLHLILLMGRMNLGQTSMPAQYGLYATADVIRNTDPNDLKLAAYTVICRIAQSTLDMSGARVELEAEHCAAKMLGDREHLKWLERVSPPR